MTDKIIENIKAKMSIDEFVAELEDKILDYADYEQMEDEGIEDEYEFYENFRNDEAEDDIFQYLIERENPNLELDDYMIVYENIKDYYLEN